MVHVRLNEKESNPNPAINFTTVLPAYDEDKARQLLRALAAQVRPIMKDHGFVINSLEEYEHNSVFLGRNWNNGETVELVLRNAGGSFISAHLLMSTLCHELAHIKHMNHGPDFQRLWSQLRVEVRKLQDKGYYGDGLWSSGQRLASSSVVPGDGIGIGEMPEYMCGGAQNRSRPSGSGRTGLKRRRKETVASHQTGRQTEKKRKAGGRVTSKYAFEGEGTALEAGSSTGTGFRKQAGSKRAREERALAAEKRLRLLQNKSAPDPEPELPEEDSSDDGDTRETDADRKQTLLESKDDDDIVDLTIDWNDFKDDFVFLGNGQTEVIDISSDDEADVPTRAGRQQQGNINHSKKPKCSIYQQDLLMSMAAT